MIHDSKTIFNKDETQTKSKAQHRQWLEKVIPVTKLPNKLTAYRISQELDIVCSNKWKFFLEASSYSKLIIWKVKAIVQSQLYLALIANDLLNYLIFKHEFCFKKVNHYLGNWIFPFSFIWINKRYLIVWTSKFQNMNLRSILMSNSSACNIQWEQFFNKNIFILTKTKMSLIDKKYRF